LVEAADEVMMAFVVTGEPKLEFVVVQEGDARDNLLPPPPASLRRLGRVLSSSMEVWWRLRLPEE
jgi:hypothetical protein